MSNRARSVSHFTKAASNCVNFLFNIRTWRGSRNSGSKGSARSRLPSGLEILCACRGRASGKLVLTAEGSGVIRSHLPCSCWRWKQRILGAEATVGWLSHCSIAGHPIPAAPWGQLLLLGGFSPYVVAVSSVFWWLRPKKNNKKLYILKSGSLFNLPGLSFCMKAHTKKMFCAHIRKNVL